MSTIISVAATLGILIFIGFLVLRYIDYKYFQSLKILSREELEKIVYKVDGEYFEFIGTEHKCVKEFVSMVEKRDLEAISTNWKKMSGQFRKLELQAGHEGRPLIMDYYGFYEQEIKALRRKA